MKVETSERTITIILVSIILGCLTLISLSAHGALTKVDEHNAIFTDFDGVVYDIFNSTDLDHSCRLTIPATCSVFDVGQFTYPSVHTVAIGEDLLRRVLDENTGQLNLRNNPMWFFNPDFSVNSITCDFINPTTPNTEFVGGAICGSTALEYITATVKTDTSVVPVPAAAFLFGSGLIGLVFVARRK